MIEEGLRRAPGYRATRHPSTPARLDPARLEQNVERSPAERHAPDFLDFGPGHRLLVGDDRQCFQRGARELARQILFGPQEPRKIGCRPKRPAAAPLGEVYAARGIHSLEVCEERRDIRAVRESG